MGKFRRNSFAPTYHDGLEKFFYAISRTTIDVKVPDLPTFWLPPIHLHFHHTEVFSFEPWISSIFFESLVQGVDCLCSEYFLLYHVIALFDCSLKVYYLKKLTNYYSRNIGQLLRILRSHANIIYDLSPMMKWYSRTIMVALEYFSH